MFRRLWRIFIGICIGLGVLTLLLLGVGITAAILFEPKPSLPERMLLTLHLNGTVSEAADTNPLARLTGPAGNNLAEILLALRQARSDERVQGLIVDLDGARLSLAQAQELRAAVKSFRGAGKPAYAHASSFDNGNYYLATAFSHIAMQPSGDFFLTGLGTEVPFIRDLLERIGIGVEVIRREEFKNAFDSAVNSRMSAAQRQAMESLLADLQEQMTGDIAADRSLKPALIGETMARTPLSASEALARNLVDSLDYWENFIAATAGKMPLLQRVDFYDYARTIDEGDGRKIAVVLADGAIAMASGPGGINEGIGAASLAPLLRKLAKREDIAAIVLRINSPGGTYPAADRLRETIARTGKPVIVSMGSYAASGGYLMAIGGDGIVSLPATVTGSIGVIVAKPNAEKLWADLGINWDTVATNPNATIFSLNRPFTPEQRQRMEKAADRVYRDFVAAVAKSRGMNNDEALTLAKGRVWSGRQAQQRNLTDRIGGLETAIAWAAQKAGLKTVETGDILLLPREDPKDILRRLARLSLRAESLLSLRLVTLLARIDAMLGNMTPGTALRLPQPALTPRG